MRALLLASLTLAACSNAADSTPDALVHHVDGSRIDGSSASDASATGAPLRILVLNEIVASGTPDWFEIVNATTTPVQLSDFLFVDAHDDFVKAVPFPAQLLGPGAFATQDVDGTVVPFKLASDEELWIYRASDHALSDGVDWAEGDSPVNGSFARIPDTFAPFQISAHPTKGTPNQL